MSKPSEIVTAIQTALLANNTVKQYVQENIFIGVRESIIFFPCIVIEVASIDESDSTYPIQKQTMTAVVAGLLKITDPEKQLVGDDNDKGLLDFLNDVKLALCTDATLGGKAVHLVIANAAFTQDMYPVRCFQLTVKIAFEQNARTRL